MPAPPLTKVARMRRLAILSALLLAACNNSPSKPAPTDQTSATTPSATPSADPGLAKHVAVDEGLTAKHPDDGLSKAPPAPEDVAEAPKDAKKTASGLSSKVIKAGTGKEHPAANDKVKVNYTGWTKDGKAFDSSLGRGEPAEFSVGEVIKGWTEGLQLMVVGETRRLWIPSALAYGDRASIGGAPKGDLVFDVELLELKHAPKAPDVPADVKAPPATAKKTASGLAYRVLTPGKGTRHPLPTDHVSVHYSGWTTDGKMFDSSVTRGEPASLGLNQVIKGWTEGIPLMVEGEKTRFWIPAALAYGDPPKRPGAPAGMLVFDVELLAIQ